MTDVSSDATFSYDSISATIIILHIYKQYKYKYIYKSRRYVHYKKNHANQVFDTFVPERILAHIGGS